MAAMKDGNIVHEVENFMLGQTHDLQNAQMERFVVQSALDKQRNLVAEGLDALQIVLTLRLKCGEMMETDNKFCHGCKSIRTSEARLPRQLIRLPIEVTQDKIFNNRGLPVFLCEFCDAHELEMALATHQKRIDNK